SLNVATPALAACVAVPESVAPTGQVPNERMTVAVNEVTGLFSASSAVTTIAGVITDPATTLLGCVVDPGCVPAALPPLNTGPVALVNPPVVASSVTPAPSWLSVKSLNVAAPPTAATVSVPPSVVFPVGSFPITIVTWPVNVDTG